MVARRGSTVLFESTGEIPALRLQFLFCESKFHALLVPKFLNKVGRNLITFAMSHDFQCSRSASRYVGIPSNFMSFSHALPLCRASSYIALCHCALRWIMHAFRATSFISYHKSYPAPWRALSRCIGAPKRSPFVWCKMLCVGGLRWYVDHPSCSCGHSFWQRQQPSRQIRARHTHTHTHIHVLSKVSLRDLPSLETTVVV